MVKTKSPAHASREVKLSRAPGWRMEGASVPEPSSDISLRRAAIRRGAQEQRDAYHQGNRLVDNYQAPTPSQYQAPTASHSSSQMPPSLIPAASAQGPPSLIPAASAQGPPVLNPKKWAGTANHARPLPQWHSPHQSELDYSSEALGKEGDESFGHFFDYSSEALGKEGDESFGHFVDPMTKSSWPSDDLHAWTTDRWLQEYASVAGEAQAWPNDPSSVQYGSWLAEEGASDQFSEWTWEGSWMPDPPWAGAWGLDSKRDYDETRVSLKGRGPGGIWAKAKKAQLQKHPGWTNDHSESEGQLSPWEDAWEDAQSSTNSWSSLGSKGGAWIGKGKALKGKVKPESTEKVKVKTPKGSEDAKVGKMKTPKGTESFGKWVPKTMLTDHIAQTCKWVRSRQDSQSSQATSKDSDDYFVDAMSSRNGASSSSTNLNREALSSASGERHSGLAIDVCGDELCYLDDYPSTGYVASSSSASVSESSFRGETFCNTFFAPSNLRDFGPPFGDAVDVCGDRLCYLDEHPRDGCNLSDVYESASISTPPSMSGSNQGDSVRGTDTSVAGSSHVGAMERELGLVVGGNEEWRSALRRRRGRGGLGVSGSLIGAPQRVVDRCAAKARELHEALGDVSDRLNIQPVPQASSSTPCHDASAATDITMVHFSRWEANELLLEQELLATQDLGKEEQLAEAGLESVKLRCEKHCAEDQALKSEVCAALSELEAFRNRFVSVQEEKLEAEVHSLELRNQVLRATREEMTADVLQRLQEDNRRLQQELDAERLHAEATQQQLLAELEAVQSSVLMEEASL